MPNLPKIIKEAKNSGKISFTIKNYDILGGFSQRIFTYGE
jgi:hypothetical protein